MRTITIRTTNGEILKGQMCVYDNLFESIINILTNCGYDYTHMRDYSIS